MPETRPELPFSLLLPVYAGDRADFLRRAFVSSVDEQTLRPDDVVLVQDGPLPDALRETCEELAAVSPVPVNLVRLERNVGLGPALDHGLEACAHDIVARMDADDISRPRRFELQLPLIADGADIVGSALLEFIDDVEDVVQTRVPPPVQPSDRGLPAVDGAEGRGLPGPAADGGLPLVRADARRRRRSGQRRRAPRLLPDRRGGVRSPRRYGAAAQRMGPPAPLPRAGHHEPCRVCPQ